MSVSASLSVLRRTHFHFQAKEIIKVSKTSKTAFISYIGYRLIGLFKKVDSGLKPINIKEVGEGHIKNSAEIT